MKFKMVCTQPELAGCVFALLFCCFHVNTLFFVEMICTRLELAGYLFVCFYFYFAIYMFCCQNGFRPAQTCFFYLVVLLFAVLIFFVEMVSTLLKLAGFLFGWLFCYFVFPCFFLLKWFAHSSN